MGRKYNQILFDVGGTLIHPKGSVGAVYSYGASQFGITIPPAEVSKRFYQAWRKIKLGWKEKLKYGISESDAHKFWYAIVWETFQGYTDNETFQPLFNYLFNVFQEPHVWEVYPEVFSILSQLKEMGYSLGILSNWDFRLPNLLKSLMLFQYFDYPFISFAVGMEKPDVNFFYHALKTMKSTPEKVLFIGNSYSEDFIPASECGIDCYLLRWKDQSDFIDEIPSITCLSKVFDLL